MKKIMSVIIGLAAVFIGASALANSSAKPWQLGLQEAASPVMENLTGFHNFLLVIITLITIFVLVLMLYICKRFSIKNNPKPSKTSHNSIIEIIWTMVPVLILLVIAVPSMKHLFYNNTIPEADMTLKVVGHQWYWAYQYPDFDNISFDSYMIQDNDLPPGGVRLLEVDNRVVLPVDTVIRVQITAADVLHNWAIPALAVKMDAVPGRLNETWVRIDKPGVYFGQCSELCGPGHGFMPVAIEAVSKEKFADWVKKQQG